MVCTWPGIEGCSGLYLAGTKGSSGLYLAGLVMEALIGLYLTLYSRLHRSVPGLVLKASVVFTWPGIKGCCGLYLAWY